MKISPRETVIMVEDFTSMIDWYSKILGFKISKKHEGDYNYCSLETETGIKIGLTPAKEVGVTPENRRNNTFVMQIAVEDVKAFFEYIKENGGTVTFGPHFEKGSDFWYGGFADPEGNPFWVVDHNCP